MAVEELAVQRRLTTAFIARNPTDIILTPNSRQSNGAGGWRKVAGTPRVSQTMSLIPQTQWRGGAEPTRTAEGEVDRIDYILVAEWNAVVAEDDTWTVGPVVYRVEFLFPSNGYEVKAGVTRHG